MPIYEYECESCGVRFERQERMTAEPLKTCPECSGSVHRVIHPVGVIFKGSGFYCTDHRSTAGLSTSKSETKDEPKSETKKDSSAAKKD